VSRYRVAVCAVVLAAAAAGYAASARLATVYSASAGVWYRSSEAARQSEATLALRGGPPLMDPFLGRAVLARADALASRAVPDAYRYFTVVPTIPLLPNGSPNTGAHPFAATVTARGRTSTAAVAAVNAYVDTLTTLRNQAAAAALAAGLRSPIGLTGRRRAAARAAMSRLAAVERGNAFASTASATAARLSSPHPRRTAVVGALVAALALGFIRLLDLRFRLPWPPQVPRARTAPPESSASARG
jgi:hypothetical protein